MSQISGDVEQFFGIVSNLFDGKATLAQTGTALDTLGSTIQSQVQRDVAGVENLLGPQAAAEINTGLQGLQGALGGAVTLLDADVAPYFAAGAKAVEGAVDTVMDAAIPGGAALNPLVNGGIDTIAAGLKATIDAQAAAWKAKLAANTATTAAANAPPATPTPPTAPAAA